MLADLAALTPPLVVCAAFLIGVVLFSGGRWERGASPRIVTPRLIFMVMGKMPILMIPKRPPQAIEV